jgi:hypothetical protein
MIARNQRGHAAEAVTILNLVKAPQDRLIASLKSVRIIFNHRGDIGASTGKSISPVLEGSTGCALLRGFTKRKISSR